jgi:hypothetical protein
MISASPFVTIEKPGAESIDWIIKLLENAALRVTRTFDLRKSRLPHTDCPCSHHGSGDCSCQMTFLLVYQDGQAPASLLIHGFQGTTWLYLVETPQQPVDQKLDLLIREVLTQSVSG